MTVEQMIQYLRVSVKLQSPSTEQDPAYLSMSDEDILLYMNVALSRDFPSLMSLTHVTNMELYPLMLLTQKELYHTLAIKEAPMYDIGADNNNYLKRDQRFKHYTSLIELVNTEYQEYLKNGSINSNTLTSYEVLLPTRYNSPRNYNFGEVPTIHLFVDTINPTSIEVSWSSNVAHFFSYKVYISEFPIVDNYSSSRIRDSATLLETIKDSRQKGCRIENLIPNTPYYIAVEAVDSSLLKGYSETLVTTLPE